MMEAVHTSETSINFNLTTRRNIPEDYKLHTRCHENLKSHKIIFYSPHGLNLQRTVQASFIQTHTSWLWSEKVINDMVKHTDQV
jgi:hypothetical protein